MSKLRIGNKSLIKDINRALVIREIREKGPISRTEISNNTKLVLSTITKICDSLFEQNIIFSIGEGESTGGRKPLNLVFNNNFGYVIAIKIEERRVILTLTNLKPMILRMLEYKFERYSGFDDVMQKISDGIDELKSGLDGKSGELLGIGFAISGIIDNNTGKLISSSLLGWEDVDIRGMLNDKYEVDIYVDNDVNCYTLAQKNYGIAKKAENFINITVGEGVGAGIVINGMIYRGAFGGAGEIGHSIIHIDGRECYCGQKGCLEAYTSDEFIISFYKEKTGEKKSIDDIISLAENGDAVATEAFVISNRTLGYGIINLIMQYNPERIIISRRKIGMTSKLDALIEETVHKNWFFNRGHFDTVLEFDDITNEKFLHGAATMVIDEIFKEPIYKDNKTIVDSI